MRYFYQIVEKVNGNRLLTGKYKEIDKEGYDRIFKEKEEQKHFPIAIEDIKDLPGELFNKGE